MTRSRFAVLMVLLLALSVPFTAALAASSHDLVRLPLDTPGAQSFVRNHTNQLDITWVKPGHVAEIAADEKAMELLRNSGLPFEVMIKDLEQHYASRNKGLGFGIYHTYSENVAFQDSLRLLYPHVVSEKWSIGQTANGNDLWAFRVSANPDVDEDEPEIFLDGMHHAREIMASEFCIMFAEYLAQNYGTDPEITWLLDNRELYIVPIVNPDGVIYNEQTNPSGGGMWRKNRRNNGDGTYGVDPNRNYPYQWGYDNDGSSPYTDDLTFRGPYAGSEPEIQAMMNFINSRNFITHDTIHTYSNLLLFPWGYTSSPTLHDAVFNQMGEEMTRYNGYEPGQPHEAINYSVNGGTFDWVYGDLSEHDLIYSFSTEIGSSSDGFWPSEARRGPLFQENIWPHIYLMRVAGPFLEVHSPELVVQGGTIQPGQSGYLDFTVANPSITASATTVNLTVSTDDPWIQFGAAEFDLGSIVSMGSTTLGSSALPVSVDALCPDGHSATFTVTVHMESGDLNYPLSFLVGSPSFVFGDNMESGAGDWTLQGSWGTTTSQSHSPSTSLTDTPVGEYSNETAHAARINGSYQATQLSFWHRYDIESGWDYARVQVSTDGSTWNTVDSFTGTQNSWQQVSFDLSDYSGQDLQFRFVMETDYSVTEDGWYIDDIEILGAGSDNLAPATPVALGPVDGASTGGTPMLTVGNVTDPEGEAVTYGFRVYSDAQCTQLAAGSDGIAQGDGQTTWTSTPLAAGNYWWRAYAGDGEQRSALTMPIPFTVSTTSAVDDLVITGTSLKVLDSVSGGGARLQLSVPGNTRVALDIYDLRGARVRQLYTGVMDAGVRVLTWDGRDDSGRSTASGVYLLRMMAGAEVRTGRVVVVR